MFNKINYMTMECEQLLLMVLFMYLCCNAYNCELFTDVNRAW